MQQVQISKDRFRCAVVVFPVVQNDFFSCVLHRFLFVPIQTGKIYLKNKSMAFGQC